MSIMVAHHRNGTVPSSVPRFEIDGWAPRRSGDEQLDLRDLAQIQSLRVHVGTALALLLIEDNPGDADLIRAFVDLRLSATSLTVAERLADGVRWLAENATDCVLLDLSLPDSHGLAALDALLGLRNCPAVVVLTGSSVKFLGEEAMAKGAQDFLVKGTFDAAALERCLRYSVERHRYAVAIRDSHRELTTEIVHRERAEQALQRSEQMYRNIVELAGEGIWLLDAEDKTFFVNPRMAAMLGYLPQELVGQSWLDLVRPEHHATVSRILGARAAAPADAVEVSLLHQAGDDIWVTMGATPVRYDDVAYQGALVMVSDVTERRAQDRALQDAQERIQQAFISSLAGTAVVALDGRILEVNPALEEILGLPAADLATRRLQGFVHRDQREAFAASLAELRVGGRSRIYDEFSLRRDDGRPLEARLAIVLIQSSSGTSYAVCQIEDVTARKMAEDGLLKQSLHDGLTGLANRTLLHDRLTQALSCRDRSHDSLAVLFLDIDRFKLVNDTYGHSIGDALLIQIARRLERHVRPEDTVARLGGDEFVVLLTDVPSRAEALRIAERARSAIGEVVSLGSGTFVPSVSIGIAFSGEQESADDLLQHADEAMYRAKEGGRNRCEVFVTSASTLSGRRLHTEGVLHVALATEQLLLYYQPVLDLATGRLTGAEALMRVVDSEHRVLEPREFLDVAEDTGQIVAMGRWAIEEAIRTTSEWQRFADADPFQVSVNLSARQLVQVGFSQMVQDLATEHGLAPGALCLELTESVLMDQDSSPATLGELAQAGMGIALDDFGTGFCSLAYLRRYPVDRLKIDRMFVAGLGKSPQDEAIVRTIVGLGQALGLDITAEGVETQRQAAALRAMGCPHVQGFLYGRPMPKEEFEHFAWQRCA